MPTSIERCLADICRISVQGHMSDIYPSLVFKSGLQRKELTVLHKEMQFKHQHTVRFGLFPPVHLLTGRLLFFGVLFYIIRYE